MKVVTDIDGVLFKDFLAISRRFPGHNLLCIPFAKYFYKRRAKHPCDSAKNFLVSEKRWGHQVIVVSSVSERFRELVEATLVRAEIPMDRLFLRPKRESPCEFKARVVREVGCSAFMDDDPKMIEAITSALSEEGFVRVAVVKANGYYRAWFTPYRVNEDKEGGDKTAENEQKQKETVSVN